MTAAREPKPDGRIRPMLAILGHRGFSLACPRGRRCTRAVVDFPMARSCRVLGLYTLPSSRCPAHSLRHPVLLESFGRFALQGVGTPAPVFPTQHLVVKGFYCYVRNPMYLAVVSLILSQALLLGDIDILVYATLAWLVMHLFVRTYEEPTLRKSFGAEYEIFCAHVPRWIPRLTPWHGDTPISVGRPG
jgi:hypothetical protein